MSLRQTKSCTFCSNNHLLTDNETCFIKEDNHPDTNLENFNEIEDSQ